MKKKYFWILPLISLLIAGPTFGGPTAVVITVGDHSPLINKDLSKTTANFLREQLPGTKVIEIFAETDGLDEMYWISVQIQKQLADNLDPADFITHLVINTHGNTGEYENEKVTHLSNMGAVFESGLSKEIQENLELLKGRVDQNLVVVMNACKTLCGSEDSAIKRARVLLNYLGSRNGTLYGATTYEGPQARLMRPFKVRDFFFHKNKKYFALPIILGVLLASLHSSHSYSEFLTIPLWYFVIGQVFTLLRLNYQEKIFNRGYLVVFKGEEAKEVHFIEKTWENFHTIYGLPAKLCNGLLSPLIYRK